MKPRVNFYLFVAALVVLNSVLLRSPNLLGKIGLIIYKYNYLRTFPKTLLTVSLVVGAAVAIAEVIRLLVKREILKMLTARVILLLFLLAATAMLVKTGMDFTTWTYSHTGLRFRLGAYLLPTILMIVFFYGFATIPKIQIPTPLPPKIDDQLQPSEKKIV